MDMQVFFINIFYISKPLTHPSNDVKSSHINQLKNKEISVERRIYFYDTDAGGVVYYGNYLSYLEESRTEFLEKKGLRVPELEKRGLLYAVRKCSITYRSPARYGETLICDARLKEVTAAQFIFAQTIHEKKTQRLIAEAEVCLVCLNKDFKPTQIPEDLKQKLV